MNTATAIETKSPIFEALVRVFGWATISVLVVFVINNYLNIWLEWPGVKEIASGSFDYWSIVQAVFFVMAVLVVLLYVVQTPSRSLLSESLSVERINSYLMRVSLWSVVFIGIVDFSLAFLSTQGFLVDLLGSELARNLNQAIFRGVFVHMPLIGLSWFVAVVSHKFNLGVLVILVASGELAIVISRFIFSFEQSYMGDLVRFWYAGLFLFGSAYTLRKDGHVRVDIFHAKLTRRTQGAINAVGSLVLGMPFCWLIIIVSMSGKTGVFNSALLTFEREGSGGGMNILYLMTVFMSIFAVLMLIELVAVLFSSTSQYLGYSELPNSESPNESSNFIGLGSKKRGN